MSLQYETTCSVGSLVERSSEAGMCSALAGIVDVDRVAAVCSVEPLVGRSLMCGVVAAVEMNLPLRYTAISAERNGTRWSPSW
jgi:hypothetical protein